MAKLIEVPEEQIFRWIGSRKLKAKPPRGKHVRATDEFVRQYGADALKAVLKDGSDDISFDWVVKKMLELYYSAKTNSQTKLDIIREFRDLIRMGALQYADLEKYLSAKEAGAKPVKKVDTEDPFVPAAPKLAKKKETA